MDKHIISIYTPEDYSMDKDAVIALIDRTLEAGFRRFMFYDWISTLDHIEGKAIIPRLKKIPLIILDYLSNKEGIETEYKCFKSSTTNFLDRYKIKITRDLNHMSHDELFIDAYHVLAFVGHMTIGLQKVKVPILMVDPVTLKEQWLNI